MRQIKTDANFSVFSNEADIDYMLARHIASLGSSFHRRAGVFCQMACEKYLKALSVQSLGAYLESHKLLHLAAHVEHIAPYLKTEETKNTLEIFDAFEQVGRYGAAANYDPLSKPGNSVGIDIEIGSNIEFSGVSFWQSSHINLLDSFVYNVRGLLDFSIINIVDGIQSLIDDDKRHIFSSQWNVSTSARDALMSNNKHFN